MRRSPGQTRYYLEVPVTDTVDDWPEPRVRDELSARLGEGERLREVPFGDITLLDLRMRVTEPMQQGRLLLAGDAAHLITPAGGQGHEPGHSGRRGTGPRAY
jgi:p-hydroxybenzoate 3-monooxygenase